MKTIRIKSNGNSRKFYFKNRFLAEIDFSNEKSHLFLRTSKNGGLSCDYSSSEEAYYRAELFIEDIFSDECCFIFS